MWLYVHSYITGGETNNRSWLVVLSRHRFRSLMFLRDFSFPTNKYMSENVNYNLVRINVNKATILFYKISIGLLLLLKKVCF